MPKRIIRRRTKGWAAPADCIYVGRPTLFGNPWIPGRPAQLQIERGKPDMLVKIGVDLTPLGAVARYRAWLNGEFQKPGKPHVLSCEHALFGMVMVPVGLDEILAALPSLRGRNLMCWCGNQEPCHVDVLIEFANR